MLPPDYLGCKKCLDALDELLSVYKKMAAKSESQTTKDILGYRIKFIGRLSTIDITFEDQVKILTQLINSRTTMKKHFIEISGIDSAIHKRMDVLTQLSVLERKLSVTIKPIRSQANLGSVM